MKGSNFIWFICCELLGVGCALFLELVPTLIFLAIGIAPFVVSYLREIQRTKQLEIAENANTERKKIESQTRIREMELYKETVLEIAAISPPRPEKLEKHNYDNIIYFEDTAKKRMTQIISEPEHDADKSLPAYYENLKENISDDTNGFNGKSMLQKIINKDDKDET